MKKILLVLGVFLMGVSFSSCDEDDIKDLLPSFDVNLNETLYIPLDINQTNGERVSFSEVNFLSIDNLDTEDYLDKIKEVKIISLSYKIVNFNGDPVGDVSGSFKVAGQVSLSNEFVVKTSADNGVVYNIDDVNELSRIANALLSKKTVGVEYAGDALCDDDNMSFQVEVSFVAKVTIDP